VPALRIVRREAGGNGGREYFKRRRRMRSVLHESGTGCPFLKSGIGSNMSMQCTRAVALARLSQPSLVNSASNVKEFGVSTASDVVAIG
jgi:hypothetical protein